MIFVGGVEGVFDKQDRYRDARLSGVIFDWARLGGSGSITLGLTKLWSRLSLA